MQNLFYISEADAATLGLEDGRPAHFRRAPLIARGTVELPGGGALENTLSLRSYDARPPPPDYGPDMSTTESVPMTVYRALHPLLRLLQIIGFVPYEIRVNPPAPTGVTMTRGTRPVTIDLTRMEAIPFDISEPDFVDRPLGFLELPGAAAPPNLAVNGACILFRHVGQLGPAAQLLRDMEILAQIDPDTALDFGCAWDEKSGALGFNLEGFSSRTFLDFTAGLQARVEDFIEAYLIAFEQNAQFHLDSMAQIDSTTLTIQRPTGPSGLMIDPMNWSHLFRYGESRSKRRARINVADKIGQIIWDYYGKTPERAVELLRSEAFGVKITPAPNPEESGPQNTEPYYQLVSLRERMSIALTGTIEDNGGTPDATYIDAKLRRWVGKWATILTADLETMQGSYNGYHDHEPAPTASQFLAAPLTGFVMDGLNRRMIGYRGLPHENSFDLGGAGFGLRSKVLQPAEGLMMEVVRGWDVHRPHSIRALRLLSGILANIRESFVTSDAIYAAAQAHGTPAEDTAPSPDQAYADAIQQAANFRDTLSYPREVFDALALCKTARDKIAHLVREGAAEARLNDPVVRGDTPGYTQRVTPEMLFETWEAIGIALSHVDRFFVEAEGFQLIDLLAGGVGLAERFIDGFMDGLPLNTPAARQDLLDLLEKWLKSLPVQLLLQPVMFSGVLWGAAKKIYTTVWEVYGIAVDPVQFVDQITKAIEAIFQQPLGDLFYALGLGLGSSAYAEIQRLKAIENPAHFIFELGVLVGPIVLEIVISWFLQAYVIVPLTNAARTALSGVILPALRVMDPVDNLVTATRRAPDLTPDPDMPLPDTPFQPNDPLPDLTPDGVALPVKPALRSVSQDAIEASLGPRTATLSPPQQTAWRGGEMIPPDERPAMRADFVDAQDPPGTRVLTPEEQASGVWEPDNQSNIRGRMADNRFEVEDRLGALRQQLTDANIDLPVSTIRTPDLFSAEDIDEMIRTLDFLVHNERVINYAKYDNLMRHFGPDSTLSGNEKIRMLHGMARIRAGVADDRAFSTLLRVYGTTQSNSRVFLIIGQDWFDIPPSLWASATFPDGTLHHRLPQLLAQGIPDRFELDEVLEPLTDGLKTRIGNAFNDKDYVQDRFAGSEITFATTDLCRELVIIAQLPEALRDEATRIYNAFGVIGWKHRGLSVGLDSNGVQFFSRPNWRFPSLPEVVEMWVKRNHTKRTPQDYIRQSEVSAGYNSMLDDSNLTVRVHAGHLIAHRHGGPTTGANMIPMSSNFNVAAYGRIERMTDWCLKYHDDVYVQVEVVGYQNGLATRLRYKAYVPDADGNPRLLVDRELDADVLDGGSEFDLP